MPIDNTSARGRRAGRTSRKPARRDAAGGVEAVVASAAYRELVDRLRLRIREAQTRAATTVNAELVMLYGSIGREILQQQRAGGWGDDVVGRIAEDLATDSGAPRGFTRRNLFYMRRFAAVWADQEKVPSVMAQIGWTAHRTLLDSFGQQPELYLWYAAEAAENRWSVRYLKSQIDLRLHERRGTALTNFAAALEPAEANSALVAVKDPYTFDFLRLGKDVHERQLEQALMDDIQRFLLELGSGFAFYGRQRSLLVGSQEFFPDLLFYHHALRRFVVIELKIGPFQVEYVSKVNFYLGAIDEQLRQGDDRESVGIILCTARDETVARLALRRVYAPIAVSTWQAGASPDGPAFEDVSQLVELDEVRTRLIDRVARRAPQIIDTHVRRR